MAIISPRAGQLSTDPAPVDWHDPTEHRRKLAEDINRIDALLRAGPPRAMVNLSANESINDNSATKVPWDASVYDLIGDNIDVWWSAGSPTRLTVPAKNGIRRVRVGANTDWATAGGQRSIIIHKNGSSFVGNPQHRHVATGGAEINLHSRILEVVDGDYFELQVYQNSGAPLLLQANNQTWFAIEAV